MYKSGVVSKLVSVMLIFMIPILVGCASGKTAGTQTTTTNTPVSYTVPQLKYILIAKYPGLFWCDPDIYPVSRQGQEQQNAIAQFPTIKANQEEFAAILQHLDLPVKTDYTDEEKLMIYRQYKLLTYGLELTGTSSPYSYTLRTGENQGYRITGTISSTGTVKEMTKTTSFNTCPICLSKGTLISTPLGPIPVEDLRQGMVVWTQDESGQRIEAIILKTVKTPVPQGFEMVKITLNGGRSVTASPGHPSAALKPLGDYHIGDLIDGSEVTSVEHIAYNGEYTFDILPAGKTGTYWANGILLMSTIR